MDNLLGKIWTTSEIRLDTTDYLVGLLYFNCGCVRLKNLYDKIQ